MTCFNPKGSAHLSLKGIWVFAGAEHRYQHFVALKELFSCFPTGAKNHRAVMEHWDIDEVFDQLSPWLAKTDYYFH